MLIKVGYEMAFSCPEPVPMVLMFYLHPSRAPTIRSCEPLIVQPQIPISDYIDTYGNRCGRIVAPAGLVVFRSEALVEDCGLPDMQVWDAPQHDVQELPNSALLFLLASRYCEVDSELKQTAWSLFAQTPPGWLRVQAICNFVHRHIRFDYNQARPNRTALEAFRERAGVCRDYMHLAITFCRCMNIPARYCTGYLGDIGVPAASLPDGFQCLVRGFFRWTVVRL